MLKTQTLAVECPKRSKVACELSIELTDFSAEAHEISVTGPDGQQVPHRITDDGLQFQHCDGPGVARFQAVLRHRSENAEPKDAITIEVVVLPETEPAVRNGVGAVISAMGFQAVSGGSVSGQIPDISAEAFRLQKSFGDTAAVEVLRRLALDRGDTTNVLRCLHLLTDLMGRTTARWLAPMASAVLGDLAGSVSHSYTVGRLLDLLERLALTPREKWYYLLRAAQDLACQRGRAIGLLRQMTPAEYRSQTASVVLEICSASVDGRSEACRFFDEFSFAPAAPQVLQWLQTDRSLISPACKLLARINDRTAAPVLRSLLDRPGYDSGDEDIVDCLTLWQDQEAQPIMVKKLAACGAEWQVVKIAGHLLRFGAEVVPMIQEVQQQSGPDQARWIAKALAPYVPAEH